LFLKSIKSRFHLEKDDKKGSFTVTTFTIEECIAVAEEEVEKSGAESVVYYFI